MLCAEIEKATLAEEVELYVVYAKRMIMYYVFKTLSACN